MDLWREMFLKNMLIEKMQVAEFIHKTIFLGTILFMLKRRLYIPLSGVITVLVKYLPFVRH